MDPMIDNLVLLGPFPAPYGGVSIYHEALMAKLRSIGYSPKIMVPNLRSLLSQYKKNIEKKFTIADSSTLFFEYPSIKVALAWFLMLVLKKFRWVKYIHDGSLPDRYPAFSLCSKIIVRYMATRVTEFIVVNEVLRDWLCSELHVTQPIHVISSLLPLSKASFDAEPSEAIRRVTGSTSKKVVCVGTFIPNYGFHHVAEAIESLRAEMKMDIKLIFISGGFAGKHHFRLQLTKNRRWISIFEDIPRRQVLALMRYSDVFVRACKHESYGLSRIEALWCGLPVVATDAGETRGMLTYQYGDLTKLKQQLRKTLESPPVKEIAYWSNQYTKEAEANFEAILKVLAPSVVKDKHISTIRRGTR